MLTRILEKLTAVDAFDRTAKRTAAAEPDRSIFAALRDAVGLRTKISTADLERIPRTGPVIFVSNHPSGFADGLVVPAVFDAVRGDTKTMAHHWFERWPALAGELTASDALHIRTIAAEFDTAEEIVDTKEIDLLALRVEPLDILTHAHFAETVRDGQDDGENLLYSVYRYVDARIAEVHERIDADDVFIVMSDHGIRTAMEHSRHGIFVATGPGIPQGRVPGRPARRGVSVVLGNLLGVETDWPETGVAPWARSPAADGGVVAAEARKPDSPRLNR